MTFQGQGQWPSAVDVPSDLVSSNFDLWMQQEEARVQVCVCRMSIIPPTALCNLAIAERVVSQQPAPVDTTSSLPV